MTCRAATSATTCAGTPTGAQLAYDAEGQLVHWQNAPSAPTTMAGYLYDGEGNRVEQQVTSGGTTTSTVYVGALEDVATTGSTSTTTTYYYAGGQRVALAVNGVFSYLASDGLGSANVALDATGTPQAVTLYAPYGTVRYTSGTMPGSDAYTGQHADAATRPRSGVEVGAEATEAERRPDRGARAMDLQAAVSVADVHPAPSPRPGRGAPRSVWHAHPAANTSASPTVAV
jgi:YD repeat-containing protein